MNLYHVQKDPLWEVAPKACRSDFIEAMRDKQYGASETEDAWAWFYMGWMSGHAAERKT